VEKFSDVLHTVRRRECMGKSDDKPGKEREGGIAG